MSSTSLTSLLEKALQSRTSLLEKLHAENTDTYRLFHGVNEGLPGLAIDRYGPQILVQTFREPIDTNLLEPIKPLIAQYLDSPAASLTMIYNHRTGKKAANIPLSFEPENSNSAVTPMVCRETNLQYRVIGSHAGQDPLLFIDLRAARRLVKQISKGKSLLNLFSYTCGVGIAAAASGAKKTWNVDFAASYLDYGKENAQLNNISEKKISFIKEDVIAVIRQLSGLGIKGRARKRDYTRFSPTLFDILFLDPPTWTKSPFGAVDIIRDYQSLFKPALLCLKPGGIIICTNHAAAVPLDQWLNQLKRCALKTERPIKNLEVIHPEPDFPSPDQNFPLKIAAIEISS